MNNMALPKIDASYLVEFLTALLNTPSPTGLSEAGIRCVEEAFLDHRHGHQAFLN